MGGVQHCCPCGHPFPESRFGQSHHFFALLPLTHLCVFISGLSSVLWKRFYIGPFYTRDHTTTASLNSEGTNEKEARTSRREYL